VRGSPIAAASDLLARAQDTPNSAGLLNLPRFLRVPAEMDIHRRDLDRAAGVPNRGGTFAIIRLQFDPATAWLRRVARSRSASTLRGYGRAVPGRVGVTSSPGGASRRLP
jgi:hypothetical protein